MNYGRDLLEIFQKIPTEEKVEKEKEEEESEEEFWREILHF